MQDKLTKHQAVVDAFAKDLFASFPEAVQCFEKPYLAYPDPIFGIRTRPPYIFDDTFWDIFHVCPLHICHIAWLAKEGIYEIRFKIDERRLEGKT